MVSNYIILLLSLISFIYSLFKINDIKILGEENCRYFTIAVSSKNELIFESTYEGNDLLSNKRYFYGFTNDGRQLFTDKYLMVPTYEKTLKYENTFLQKHFSENVFFNVNNANSNSQSLKVLSIGNFFEIYDYDKGYDGNVTATPSLDLIGNKIFSDRSSLFELKNEKNTYIFAFNDENNLHLIKFNYNSNDVKNGFNKNKIITKTIFGTNMISCYDTEFRYFVCFYRNKDAKFAISVYNSGNMAQISNEKIIDDKSIDSYSLFFKAIYLNNNIGIFVYFNGNNENKPILEINQFEVGSNRYTIKPYLNNIQKNKIIINNNTYYNIYNNYNKNDIVKINDKRFSLISITQNNRLIIIIFDLYNGDKNNLLIKYYFNNLNSHNFMIIDNIRGYSLLETLGIGYTSLDTNTNKIFTHFINFGYYENNDTIIDLFFVPNDRCYYFSFLNFTTNKINNNIFGYKVKGIKIISVPNNNNIRFYYNSSEIENYTFLQNNSIVSMDKIIRVEVWGNSNKEKLVYAVLYEDINNYTDLSTYFEHIEYYGDDHPNNYYKPNSFPGRSEFIQFTLSIIDFIPLNATFCGENYSSGSSGGGSSGSSSQIKCHNNCLRCNDRGIDSDQNCTLCKHGLAIKEDEEEVNKKLGKFGNNCYNYPIDFYYLNTSINLEYRLIKCYNSCNTCSGKGNESNHNCLTCRENYYEKEDSLLSNNRNCYQNPLKGYVLVQKENKKIFVKCDESCINCSSPKDISSTYCIECNTSLGYYSLEDNIQMCVKNIQGYFLGTDPKDNITKWFKCETGCKTCKQKYDKEKDDMHCLDCVNTANNNYYLKNGTNNCYREPLEHYYLKEDKGIIKFFECSENCLNCLNNPDYCISCKQNWNFNEREHICTYKCIGDEYFDFEKRKCTKNCSNRYYYKDPTTKNCINCKDKNQYLLIYGNDQKCVDAADINDGYFFNDENKNTDEYKFNVLESCYNSCKKCSGKSTNPQNQKCISCKENYYLVDGTTNCEEKCSRNETIDKYYYKDKGKGICINCHKNNNGKIYKFIDEDECISKNDLDKRPYNYRYIDINTGVLEKCFENCMECYGYSNNSNNMMCLSCKHNFFFKEGTSNCYNVIQNGTFFNSNKKIYQDCNSNCLECEERADKCTKCRKDQGYILNNNNICIKVCDSNKYLLGDDCVESCGNYYYQDVSNKVCVNCKEKNKYIDLNNLTLGCIDKRENYYENTSNTEFVKFGVIQKCHDKCKSCYGNSTNDNDQKCITCKSNTYLRYEMGNCMDSCDDVHDYYYVIDENNKCINCKKESTKANNKKEYKYIYENTCLDKKTLNERYGGFFIIDEYTGTIDLCHRNCLTCSSRSDDDNNMLCLTCDNSKGYYMIENTTNCMNYAPDYYYLDEKNKIYSKCYSTCLTCNKKGDENNNQCILCNYDLYNYKDGEKCLRNCSETNYSQNFLTNTNYLVCLSIKCNYNDIYSNKNLVQLYYDNIQKKCVSYCNWNTYYFEDLPICIESCSSVSKYKNFVKENYIDYIDFYDEYYLPNESLFYSDIYSKCEIYCKINKNNTNRISCKEYFDQIIKDSIYVDYLNLQKLTEANKIIEIINYNSEVSSIYQFYKFKPTEISKNTKFFSGNDDISDINLEDCFKDLTFNVSDTYQNQSLSLIFYKMDKISDQALSNYIFYDLLMNNGTILNIENLCQNKTNIIYSPIKPTLNETLELIKEINESYSINLFNPDEKIFNDICEPFFYNNMDISMYIRINHFYQDYNLCQENCYYNGIKFNESKVECLCPENYIIIEQYYNERKIKSNKLFDNGNSVINKYNNIKILKCHKMFYKYSANFGFIIFIFIIIPSIASIVLFYIKDYKPMTIKFDIMKLYKLQNTVQEQKVLIEPVKPIIEQRPKKQKKSNFKLMIGIFRRENNTDIKESKYNLKNNKSKLNDEDTKTINYDKNTFAVKPLKTECKEQLIDEPKYNIIKKEISEYHLIPNYNNNTKIVIKRTFISFLKVFLNNYPMTKICFFQKDYKLMKPKLWFEHMSLNLLFYLGFFSILIIINCILFNDELVSKIFLNPSHKLPFIEYFINSCYAGVIYFFGAIFISLIFIYGIQAFYPGEVYDAKIYTSKINSKVIVYLTGIIIFQTISILLSVFGWYYSSIFCNIYNKSQKYLVIQIVLSLLIDAILHILFSIIIFFIKSKQ